MINRYAFDSRDSCGLCFGGDRFLYAAAAVSPDLCRRALSVGENFPVTIDFTDDLLYNKP